MGTLDAYRDKTPSIGAGTVLFDSAEITGDVIIGADSLIGAGVKIIGNSHGPVRIGSRVQILENAVLHLLPDNELIIDDDAVIGPAVMIHGCHIGRGTVVEPSAIVCDGSVVGAESVVRAGACVKQRDRFGARSILDGFPAKLVDTLADRRRCQVGPSPQTRSQLCAGSNGDRKGDELNHNPRRSRPGLSSSTGEELQQGRVDFVGLREVGAEVGEPRVDACRRSVGRRRPPPR
jgi:carbonic anhydrase/acetyltransferase-like protein (isoleucine patch superfamily)